MSSIQSAGRHSEIAEGFSSALAEIGRAMCLGTAILNVHKTSDTIKKLVVLLYIQYSKFFCHFMTWHLGSSWHRIKTALRNDYCSREVKPHVEEIRDTCRRIESQASLISQQHLQVMSERVLNLGNRFENGLEMLGEYVDQRLQVWGELILGQCSHNNVAAMADRHMYDDDLADVAGKSHSTYLLLIMPTWTGADQNAVSRNAMHIESTGRPLSQPSNGRGTIERPNESTNLVPIDAHHRDSLEQSSLELLKYSPVTDAGIESADKSIPGTQIIPEMMIARLGDWARSPRSEMLWIIGIAFSSVNYPNLAALHIKNMAKVANIPCISVFCRADAEFADPVDRDQSQEMNLLVALLYTLINRLTRIAGQTLVESDELRAMISSLNGQKETVSTALQAIRILLRHRSPLLLIIFDGLDQVETNETEPYLRELIDIIYADITPTSRLKVLLGSEGYLRSGSGLKTEECLDCAFLPSALPDQALPGGRFVNEIDGDVFATSF